ncbi:HAD hydrolase family protein [Salegentibacter mishustinae]|uniref:KdsC family phosphatase n=1 Tax=Salegentibacter mishustinae TaxID=270918 RepID=UPI001CE1D04D|nr:HAD hydrolase family protein [Salegentibacter mishustinae]UBZ06845.1 HAD hydrolase family protein [Salegentibacter mishustinae]
MKNIKLLVSDVDGVWTDGAFYYNENGDSMRKFNTKDSYGVSLATIVGLPILILSGEDNLFVRKRMEKLGIQDVVLGVEDKLPALRQYCDSSNISLSEVAYIGDDMNDLNLVDKVGFFACPCDAYYGIKNLSNLVLTTGGGMGAFREFVEEVLDGKGLLEDAYYTYNNRK